MESRVSNTAINLHKAIVGEAKARLEYAAFAQQALREGRPEIAQVFMEAAEDVTLHSINHLEVTGEVGSTQANLDYLINGDGKELEMLYPRFILEAEEEGQNEAATCFRLALEREKQHLAMFREAFDRFSCR
jgi:rubrerythrin